MKTEERKMHQDDNLNNTKSDVKDGDNNESVSKENLMESRAREHGWVSEDEWGGDPEEWRSAKEFLDRESFFKKINHQNNEISNLKKTVTQLSNHHRQVAAYERKRVLDELKRQKVHALEESDHDRVVEIDEQIQEVKEETAKHSNIENVSASNTDSVDTAFEDFRAKNKWYGMNAELTELANSIGIGFSTTKRAQGTPVSNEDVYKYVEREMAKFVNKQEVRGSSPVIGANETSGSKSQGHSKKTKYTVNDLSQEQKNIAKRFIQAGAIKDYQQYVDELAAIGEL